MRRMIPILLVLCSLSVLLFPSTAAASREVCPGHVSGSGLPGLPGQEPPEAAASAAPASPDTEAKEEKKDEWDVNNPPGPRTDVPIDLDEGTWMAVDVSPDGADIQPRTEELTNLVVDLQAVRPEARRAA